MLDVSELRDSLVGLRLTGELNRNTPDANRQAIHEMLGGNDYYGLGGIGAAEKRMSYNDVAKIVAHNLGMPIERFESEKPAYIDPDHTVSRLVTGFHRLEEVAGDHGRILVATAHPGSLLSFYQCIGRHLESLGGKLVHLSEPVPAPQKRWLDEIGGVIALSDEGNLMHTHSGEGLAALIAKTKPDIVLADHAYAMAAIKLGIATVAIFDVDDPAIPLLASRDTDLFVAVPMNDNQTNTRTAKAAVQLIETIENARSVRNPALT